MTANRSNPAIALRANADPKGIVFRGLILAEPVGETVQVITAAGRSPLPMRLDLRNHSPTGFAWGYAGSGPAQLALAMCCQLVDDETALRVYQVVKARLMATLPQDAKEWSISGVALLAEIERAAA